MRLSSAPKPKPAPICARSAVPLDDHPLIVKLSSFMKLSAEDLERLEQTFEAEKLVKKQKDVVVDGEAYRNLCFVRDGYALRYKLLRNGKRQILNVLLPGDVIGFPVSFFRTVHLFGRRPHRPEIQHLLDRRLCPAMFRAAAVRPGAELAGGERSGHLCGAGGRHRPANAGRANRASA